MGGDLAVIVGGRLQLDGATFREDDEISAAFGSPEEGFEVRRAFFELGALYRQRYEFRFMLDVADTVDYRDVFLGMIGIPYIGGIRAGYFKEPFGLEEIESSNDITFMERSLTDALVDRRNLGVMIHRILPGARRGTLSVGPFERRTTSWMLATAPTSQDGLRRCRSTATGAGGSCLWAPPGPIALRRTTCSARSHDRSRTWPRSW